METQARRRELRAGADIVLPTPLLIPSFSSRAIAPIPLDDAFDETIGSIVSPILVSAYDVHYQPELADFDFRAAITESELPLVFLDSGGYEAIWNAKAQEAGLIEAADARPWSRDKHESVLKEWPAATPLVAVTYDNLSEPSPPLARQIEQAGEMLTKWPQHACEFLLKPEAGRPFLDSATIKAEAARIARFPVIGVTEKECGQSMAERIQFLSNLRSLLDEHNPSIPIHVFGGLDPSMTPLYFWAGADIFDGLAWLRYAFREGQALYAQGHIALEMPDEAIEDAIWTMCRRNYRELTDLQIAMYRFISANDASEFGPESNRLVSAFKRCLASG